MEQQLKYNNFLIRSVNINTKEHAEGLILNIEDHDVIDKIKDFTTRTKRDGYTVQVVKSNLSMTHAENMPPLAFVELYQYMKRQKKEKALKESDKQICVQLYLNRNSKWISLEQNAEDVYKDIQDFLDEEENAECEEWFICDSENIYSNIHDYDFDIETLLENIELVENSHYDVDLLKHIADTYTTKEDFAKAIDILDDVYIGEFKSDVDFAENLLEETREIQEIPEHLRYYFDYEAYARDIMINDYCEFEGHYYRNR